MIRREQPLGIVLAGGEGKRLMPLTADRAKPAVPFGGAYRLIDFVLSNLVNADLRKIAVLTQYKSHSLDRHITTTWRMSTLLGNYITPVPAYRHDDCSWCSDYETYTCRKHERELRWSTPQGMTKKVVPQAPFFRYGDKELALYRW